MLYRSGARDSKVSTLTTVPLHCIFVCNLFRICEPFSAVSFKLDLCGLLISCRAFTSDLIVYFNSDFVCHITTKVNSIKGEELSKSLCTGGNRTCPSVKLRFFLCSHCSFTPAKSVLYCQEMAPSIAHVFRIKKRFACILIDLPEHVEDIIASINWARRKQRIFREFLKRNKRIAAIFCVISIMGGRK